MSSPAAEKTTTSTNHLFHWCAGIALATNAAAYLCYRWQGGMFKSDHAVSSYLERGIDFKAFHLFGKRLLQGLSPYGMNAPAGPNDYPPLHTLLLTPFSLLRADTAYLLWTAINVALLGWLVWVCLGRVCAKRNQLLFATIVGTALLLQTYPILFVLERGQTELLVLGLMVGVVLSIESRKSGIAALLLAMATNLKVFPAALLALLWLRCGWRTTIAAIAGSSMLLFIMGPHYASVFVQHIVNMPNIRWWYSAINHSYQSFAYWVSSPGGLSPALIFWTRIVELATLAIFGFVVLAIRLWHPHLPGSRLTRAEIALFGMAIAAMALVPYVSYDYKLAHQFVPFLLLVAHPGEEDHPFHARAVIAMVLLSVAVGAILAPPLLHMPATLWLVGIFVLYMFIALEEVAAVRAVRNMVDIPASGAKPRLDETAAELKQPTFEKSSP